MLGQVFAKAQNKITDPAKLFRLIDMVSGTDWVMLGADVKGDIYGGLLSATQRTRNPARDSTAPPRALIRAMVACICPKPGKTITDPACGTGGFFLAARLPDRPVELRTRQRPERIPEARDLSPTRQHARSRQLPDGGHYLQLRVHGIISALGIRHAGLRYNVRQIFASRTPEIVSAGRCGCRPQGVHPVVGKVRRHRPRNASTRRSGAPGRAHLPEPGRLPATRARSRGRDPRGPARGPTTTRHRSALHAGTLAAAGRVGRRDAPGGRPTCRGRTPTAWTSR